MGQMRDESLEQLLMLGEPEAVVAGRLRSGPHRRAGKAGLVGQDAENARHMLANPAIVAGKMGRVLAHYLLEFLPFETETEKMMASVRLILQPGLIDPVVSVIPVEKIRPQASLPGGFPPGPAG